MVLVQLDLIDLEDSNKVHESVMAVINKTSIEQGRTISIQDLLSKIDSVPPMPGKLFIIIYNQKTDAYFLSYVARNIILYRTAPVGTNKVALGSVIEVLEGKASLLKIEKLSKLELEDKNGVYHTTLWYKSNPVILYPSALDNLIANYSYLQGSSTAAATTKGSTQQVNQDQPRQVSTPDTTNPRDGFNQSKLSNDVLDWLATELEAPDQPLPGVATLSDAWDREKMFRRVKANANKRFRFKQAYRISEGLWSPLEGPPGQ